MKVISAYRKSLPRMVFYAINILFSGGRKGDFVKLTHCGNDDFVVNPVEGRVSHYPVFTNQSFFTGSQIGLMPLCDFVGNFSHTKVVECVKNPFFNCIAGDEINRQTLSFLPKSVSQFAYQLTGINYLRSKFQRVWVNIFDNDNEFRSPREGYNSLINIFRGFIKTFAY